ncbi:MAG: T9SS type A sorting domain-containing protein [Chitinophagales bacterium]
MPQNALHYTLKDTHKKIEFFFKNTLTIFCAFILFPLFLSSGLFAQQKAADIATIEVATAVDFDDESKNAFLKADCPILRVDIGSTSLQICSESQYFVYYCNEGNVVGENVQIGVTFPETITFKDSELPFERIDDVYFFNIGALEVGQCGDFAITAAVACDVLIGKTACVVASITPNTPCDPPSELWDKSDIQVVGECMGDQVEFTITNIGEGNMEEPSQYRIYEDDIFVSSSTKFSLASGESRSVFRPASGRTISLTADQNLFHPQRDTPKATVETCGQPPYSLGIVNKFPQNDQLPFTDYDCQQIEANLKGTEKLISPSGARAEKIIPGNAQLTYKIRFQNDESMPIERLVIRDILSPYLDINRLEQGASSHPYTFEILASNVLEWTFENINLPSSETDLEGSRGFIQFKIHVIDEELLDIQIDNQASMRFGNNSPVFTNPVHHFTGDLTLDLGVGLNPSIEEIVTVYPIPARDYLHFVYNSQSQHLRDDSIEIELYNLVGKKIASMPFEDRHTLMEVNDLMEGMYVYRILNKRGTLVQSGKVCIY